MPMLVARTWPGGQVVLPVGAVPPTPVVVPNPGGNWPVVGPVGPVGPVAPDGPEGPVAPDGPVPPVAPVGPVGPVPPDGGFVTGVPVAGPCTTGTEVG